MPLITKGCAVMGDYDTSLQFQPFPGVATFIHGHRVKYKLTRTKTGTKDTL